MPRLKQGAIQAAIVSVLERNKVAMRPIDIRARVSSDLGREIPTDTVTSFLSVAARSGKWPIEKVRDGQYRLVANRQAVWRRRADGG